MTTSIIISCLSIFAARAVEVALSTLRALAVNQGRKITAVVYAFFQTIIWVLVVSKVLQNLDRPEYLLSFSFGFAAGTYAGMYLENWLGYGYRVVRIFSRLGEQVADAIRKEGFACTIFDGRGKDGAVQLIFIAVQRKQLKQIVDLARKIDPECFHSTDASNIIPRV